MCGIVGYISSLPTVDRSWLVKARDSMIHRGPDDAGIWWSDDGRVGLAHRRLAIVDLSQHAHQPMHHENFGLSVIFNGEIYNHKELRSVLEAKGHSFRSQSDTEVLLASYHEWGEACLNHLNGMFAFAIYNSLARTLFVARDRAGEKPLFYRHDKSTGSLIFASELKALLSHPAAARQINRGALDCYLALGYVPGSNCILEGYNKLPPAHALKFDVNASVVKVWCYWSLPEYDPLVGEESNVDELLDQLDQLLESSVATQMIADVPVGVLLSGGVDSSLITAMAVRGSNQVKTFTIGFLGHERHDESAHARLIADYFGTEHIQLMAEPASASLVPVLAQQFDEPMVDSSMIPTWLVSHLVREHCTVALGGDGGDELFGGYPHYTRLLWLQKWLGSFPSFSLKLLASMAEHFLPLGFANSNIRSWMMAAGTDFDTSLPNFAGHFDSFFRRRLLSRYHDFSSVAESIYDKRIPVHDDLLQRATRMDFQNYLTEDILVKVDRASMLNSLEVRAPFLDYKLIEFAFGRVSSSLKVTENEKKILLKRLARRLLPAEFDIGRKQGFSIPLTEWLRGGPFRELFWDTLSSSDCLFDQQVVLSLLNGEERGQRNGERLFALVQFELWRQHYQATL